MFHVAASSPDLFGILPRGMTTEEPLWIFSKKGFDFAWRSSRGA
jgi:hypothetical protein